MVPIPGSVDLDEISSRLAEPEPKFEWTRNRILYVGTLLRIRHLEMLIDALKIVHETYPDAELHYLGKGEHPDDEKLLNDRAAELGVAAHVKLLGNQDFTYVCKYVQSSHVCLSPYYPSFVLNSTSPTKLLEYMAVGRPVVGNHHPEQREVIESCGCGDSVEWSAEAFASAIGRILGDDEYAERCAASGIDYIRKHRTHAIMGDVVYSAYQGLLD